MITIIAAIAKNNVIGNKNDLPWYLPEDLARFKKLTSGHPVIMGRKTFESILNRIHKPLPGRQHFVLSRSGFNSNPEFSSQVSIVSSLTEAISKAELIDSEIFIIGGEKVFQEALPLANKLEITRISTAYEGDAFFPEFNEDEWDRIDEQHEDFAFITYTKKN